MKNLIKKLQAVLLFSALVLGGTALMPAESQAMHPDCEALTGCPGGSLFCAFISVNGQTYKCKATPSWCI